jgi:hypothetical protein
MSEKPIDQRLAKQLEKAVVSSLSRINESIRAFIALLSTRDNPPKYLPATNAAGGATEEQPPEPPGENPPPLATFKVETQFQKEIIERYDRNQAKSYSHQWWMIILQCAMFLATSGAFIAASFYACIAHRQRTEMSKSNEINRAAMMISQRAYTYFLPDPNIRPATLKDTNEKGWLVIPVAENGGNTPAFNVLNHVNTNTDFQRLPDDFDYADGEVKHGVFLNIVPRPGAAIVIGPHRSTGTGGLSVPETIIQKVNAGKAHVYFWGWLTYDDIFGCTHKTEFCSEVVQRISEGKFFISNCEKHNCADEDCEDYTPTNTPECSLELKKKPK